MRNLSRRELMALSAAGTSAWPTQRGAAAGIGKGRSRPNILWIMSDEHNPNVAGYYGNSRIITPCVDALAASGVVFENHYCNSPLCTPSRLSITACRYASLVGAWNLNCWLPSPDIPSLPRVLNDAGYCLVFVHAVSADHSLPVRQLPTTQNLRACGIALVGHAASQRRT